MKRSANFIAATVFALFLAGGAAWAQSRIPLGDANYLLASNSRSAGTLDDWVVVFFEVPASVTSTIFFAINSPDIYYSSETADPADSRSDSSLYGTATGAASTDFYLYGGSGAFSNPQSKYVDYLQQGGTPLVGTQLAHFQNTNTATDESWVYFPGVSPSQGELVGDKRYFKVVVLATSATGWIKNGFQLDASLSSTGTPTGISGVRSFAYAWPISLREDTADYWHLYPFVPYNQPNNIVFYNWDIDNSCTLTAYGKSDATSKTAPPLSLDSTAKYGDARSQSYAIGAEWNGAWHLRIQEGATAVGDNINGAEFWFGDGVTTPVTNVFKTYAADNDDPPLPDHVVISPTAATTSVNTDATFSLQVVDSVGAPVDYPVSVQITANGGAMAELINGIDNDETISTDNSGSKTFTVRGDTIGSILITIIPVGLTGGTATLNIVANPEPTVSSASNTNFNEGGAPTLPQVTITEHGATSIFAADTNTVLIRIPTSLKADFTTPNPSATNAAFFDFRNYDNTGAGTKIARFDPTLDLTDGLTIVISSLRLTTIAGSNSSGSLELSYDGGSNWTIVDDKLITILDPAAPFIWTAGHATLNDWEQGTNWSTGTVPNAATDNVVIPYMASGEYPVLTASHLVNNLTMGSGSTLNMSTFNLTVSGNVNLSGATVSATTGTLVLAGAAKTITNGGSSVPALTLNAGASYTQTDALTVSGAFTLIAGGTLTSADNNLSVGGAANFAGTYTAGTSTVYLTSAGAQGFVPGGNSFATVTMRNSGTTTLNTNNLTATALNLEGAETLDQNARQVTVTTLNLGNGSAAAILNTTAALIVNGTATINVGAGAVTLANTGNSFTNDIVLTSGGAVSIYDTTSLGISGSASTSLTLQSASTVTQPAAGILNTPILRVQAVGGITLNEANTITSTFCASNATSGNVSLTNTGTLILGDATLASVSTASGGTVTITNTGGVTVARAVSAGTGTVRIRSGAGAITNGTGTITADTVYLQDGTGTGAVGASGAGNAILTSTSNPGTTTTTLQIGGGNATGAYISHTGALSLAAPSLAANAPLSVIASGLLTLPASAINTGSGALILTSGTSLATAGNLTSTTTVTLTANAGTLGLGHSVSGTTVTLVAFDTLSQSAGTLSGTNLSAKTRKAGGAAITLNQPANDFDSVSLLSRNAADGADEAGAITFVDADGFDIALAGIHGTALVRLTAGGAVTDAGTILSGSLALRGSGSYTLNSANAVGKLAAALTGGALNFTNSAAFDVDTVDTLPGIVLTNSTSALTLTAGANTITLYQGLTTNAGAISITTSPVSLGATVTVTNGGTVSATAPIGFPSSIISAVAGSYGLTLTAGSSNISITGAVGATSLASLDVTSAAQTTFGGAVTTAGTQSITSTTIRTNGTHSTTNSAITFTGNLTLQANTVLSAGNSTIDITGTVNGNFTLTANATGLTTLGASIGTTTALAGLTTNAGGDTSFGGSTIRTQGGGTITLNDQLRLSVDAALDTTNNAGYAAGANIALASVDANSHALTLNGGTGGILSSSANIEEVTTFTITNCASAAFTGSVGLVGTPITTVALAATISTTNAIAFNGGLFAGTFTVNAGAAAYDVTLGATGTVGGLVTFNNTGDITISSGFTFTNGATKSTAGITYLAGAISSTDGPFTFNGAGGITLSAPASLDTNASTTAGDITLGAITASTYALDLATGAVLAADVTGTSFTGGAGSGLSLADIGGTASFTGAVTAVDLAADSTVVNVSLSGSSGTISNLVEFHNTGTLRLGSAAGTLTFNGGVSTVAAPVVGGTVTLYGTIATSNDPISFGAVALGAATVLNPGSGQIDLGSIPSTANFSLDIRGTGTANLGSAGTDFLLGTGALILSNKTGSGVTIDGTTVTMGSITPPAAAQTFDLTFNADTVTVTAAATLTNVGVLTLGNADTDTFNFNAGLTKVGTSAVHLRGTMDTSAGSGGIDLTTSGGIVLYGVTTMKTGTASLQLGAVTCDIAAGHNLVIYGSGAGTATIASANLGTGGSLDLTNRGSTGTVTLSGNLTSLDLIAPSSSTAFALTLNGGSTTNGVDLTNQTGTLTINSGGFSFNGGATKPTGNITLAGGSVLTNGAAALNLGTVGTISVTANTIVGGDAAGDTGTITLSTVNISATFTLTLGSGAENASYSVTGAVNGGGSLAINTAGSSGTVTFGANVGAGTALTSLTVTNSYGVDFQGTVQAGTVTLTDTTNGQDVIFRGNLTVTTGLTTGAQPFDLFFNAAAGTQTTAITGNTNLQITAPGTITFGNNVGDVFIVNGTLTSSGTATRHLIGAIRTQAQTITFGAVTLDGDTTIDTTANGNASYLVGATVSLGAVTDGGTSVLVVNAGTAGGFTQSAGTITATSLRIIANGNIGSAMATPINTAVSYMEGLSYAGTIFMSNTGAYTVGFAGGDFETIGGAGGLSATAGMATYTSRAIGLAANAGSAITFAQTVTAGTTGAFTATANTLTINATITADGGINLYPNANLLGIALNDASGTFSLTTAELANLASAGTLTIGVTSGTGSNNAIGIGSSGPIGLGAETYAITLQGASSAIDFNFTATGNTLTLPAGEILTLNAGGAVTTDSGGTSVDVTATTSLVYAQSVTSIGSAVNPLKTQIASFRSDAGTGNVYLSETDALTIGDGTAGVSTSGGLIDILAGAAVTVANDVSTTGTGTSIDIEGTSVAIGANVTAVTPNQITLTASGGAITRSVGTVTTTGGVLALSSSANIGTSGANIATVIGTLRATASNGGIYIAETNAIQLGDGTTGLSATNGDIAITTTGAITTGNSIGTTTAGNITLTAGASTITITNNLGAAGTATFNSAVIHSANTITAGPVGIGTDAVIFVGAYTGTGGTLTGDTTSLIAGPNIVFQGNTTLGTFTHNGDQVVFSGAVPILAFNSNSQQLSNVLINKTLGSDLVRLVTSDVTQVGAAFTINSGILDLDTNNLYWLSDPLPIGAAPGAGAFMGRSGATMTLGAGSQLQCVAFTSEAGHTIANSGANTITTSGNVTIAGTFSTPANSTLVMTGTADLDSTPRIGSLIIQGGAVTLVNNPLELQANMDIQTGSLDAGADLKITVYGNWTNSVGVAGFLAQNGEVEFANAVGPIAIFGNNDWYNFRCEQPGVTVQFERNRTQRILAGGSFTVTGTSSSKIKLTRDGNQTDDLDWVPPAAPNPLLMWQIDLMPTATLPIQWAIVSYSDARSHPVVASVDLGLATTGLTAGETDATCYKWLVGIPAVYSYTEDSDGNGKIDRIRVTAVATLNFNFSGFEALVNGYDIDTTKGTKGFIPGVSQDFYIALVEKPYLDTGAKPTWKVLKNTSLRDQAFNISPLTTVDPLMTPVDNAPPVLAYTLSVPGVPQTFMVFSENVWGAVGAVLNISDFTYGPAINMVRITATGSGTSEAILNLSAAPTVNYLLGAPLLTLSAAINDTASPAPTDYSLVDVSYPAPSYLATGTPPPNAILDPTHRVTDVLISVPPSSATDSNYFVWPIWAKDSVITEIAGEDYEGLTAAEAASRTIGLVRDFTGTQWLRDQDIIMQARVNSVLGTPTALRLYFDTNVPESFLSTAANGPTGLWLPTFSPSVFSGLVPAPRTGTSTVASAAPVAPLLWNLSIDSDDPKVKSVSTFDFFFTLGAENSVNPLYVARLDIATGAAIPVDWYRHIKPFSFDIHDVKKQRSNVTILNNVIDPTKGERVRISYQITKGGSTTIQVFTLDGDLVDVLYRGNRAAGDYTASWDGKNRGGRPVARGMYFIRVVGPEIDEIRKVMIVK